MKWSNGAISDYMYHWLENIDWSLKMQNICRVKIPNSIFFYHSEILLINLILTSQNIPISWLFKIPI